MGEAGTGRQAGTQGKAGAGPLSEGVESREGRKRRIILGLPGYNEEIALPRLMERVCRFAESYEHPVDTVLYNDGSSDRTVEVAETWRRTGALQVIGTPDNRGLGAGLLGLVRHAAETGGDEDLLVLMDCDDTHDPEQIRSMVAALERDDAGIVIASRYVRGALVSGVPPLRRLTALGAMVLFKLVHPLGGVRDYTCGYRVYRIGLLRRGLDRFGDRLVAERGFACTVELLLKLGTLKPRISEVALELGYDRKPTATAMDVGGNTARLLKLLVKWRLRGFGA